MMYDTVREELQTKITPGAPRLKMTIEKAEPEAVQAVTRQEYKPRESAPPPLKAPEPKAAPPAPKRAQTAGLSAPKTSPTLVEFQNKNASLPDWRLQLQNAVQQRKGGGQSTLTAEVGQRPSQFPVNGGAALKAEVVTRPEPDVMPAISDPRVANAMRRIAASRTAFLESEKKPEKRPAVAKPYRFGVVSTNSPGTAAAPAPVRSEAATKPALVKEAPAPITLKRDTNKLPRIEEVEALPVDPAPDADSVEIKKVTAEAITVPAEPIAVKRIHIIAEPVAEEDAGDAEDINADDIEDLAPFSMRFSAGLFDLIISAFAAGLILSPLAFTGAEWFTGAGLVTYAATWAIASFLYMTLCLGFFGKTMGMRLFSLELVDAVENEYPTLRQAGINSAVFLVSLAFGGLGFLTTLFNEERRALHDLMSGTIIVREF
jgi:uncharacterized RDD family membrane protein YckC